MATLTITIAISRDVADLASREAWRAGLHWREWLARECERLLEARVGSVCWPTKAEKRERVSYV
jgi:hypothetical protein